MFSGKSLPAGAGRRDRKLRRAKTLEETEMRPDLICWRMKGCQMARLPLDCSVRPKGGIFE